MLTDKMQALYSAIELMIESGAFEKVYLEYIFSGLTSKHDVIMHTLIELCKRYFDSSQESHSLNYYLKGKEGTTDDIDDSERMRIRRTLDYINNNRESLYLNYCKEGIILKGLHYEKKHEISEKLKGLELNPFQFWEIANTHDLLMIKAIVNHQLKSKNFSSERFREYAKPYDDGILEIKNMYKDTDPLFASFAYFILEADYYLDFYYSIADYLIENKITPPEDLETRAKAFVGNVTIHADLFCLYPELKITSITTNNRMIILRKRIIESIINMGKSEFEIEKKKYAECLALASLLRLRILESGEIKSIASKQDWISLVETYNVYQCFDHNKQWTKGKVRIVKRLYKRY